MDKKQQLAAKFWIIWIFFIYCSEAPAQKADTSLAPLDVILLIDNSASTRNTDPQGLRLSSARFLIDYLELYAQMKAINCCVGMASFGGTVGNVAHLQPIENRNVKRAIRPEKLERTDFRPPLEWAFKEFRGHSHATNNRKVALLFTDGRPHLGKDPLSSEDKKRYFRDESFAPGNRDYNLKKIVGDLQAGGVVVFVVTVGDTEGDMKLWQQLLPQHYYPIDATTDLSHLYHRLFADFVGLMPSRLQTLPAGKTHQVELPHHLSGVIFSFFKNNPDIRITLRDPAGNLYDPAFQEGRYALQKIAEPGAGVWQVEVLGDSVQMYVDMGLPQLGIEKPKKAASYWHFMEKLSNWMIGLLIVFTTAFVAWFVYQSFSSKRKEREKWRSIA